MRRPIGELLGRCSLVMVLATPLPFLPAAQAANSGTEAGSGESAGGASDLLRLYRQAQSQDPRVLAAQAAARQAEYQQREALGQLLPQMSVESRLTRTDYQEGQLDTNYSGERYAASISQVVFDMPVWQSYQRSRALSEQARSQGEDDIQGATADLVQRYFDVLAAQDSLELILAEKRVVERNLERVDSLYERQMASITEKLEVEARLDRLKSDQIEAENRIWVAREGLAEVIGRPVYEQLERLEAQPDLVAAFDLKTHEYWRDLALATNPLMQARLAAVEAQRRAQQGAFGGHLPKLSLQLSTQKSNIGYENSLSNQTESSVAALNIQIPLFAGGSTQARTDAAYEGLLVAQQELEKARRQVLREVRTAFLNSESSLAKVAAARVALASAVKAREAAEKSFTFGINNAVDVLDRTREQYSAHRDLLEAQYSFLLSYIVLKRWSGTLNETDLEQVNALLEAREVEYAASTAG